MSLWTCPRGHGRRELTVTKGGAGIPACPACQSAMEPVTEHVDPVAVEVLPGLAEAIERLDPELQQEPP